MSSSGFHNKYRPRTLDQVLGNSQAVRTLSTFIEKNQYPSAILITGPTSAGKTTLGRAFAADSLGVESVESSPNFEDVNFSESRTIDDVRALISQSRLRPLNGTRRFIVCDEAHGILSNAPAANAFLKPLEEPVPSTTWILSSMEGDKFSGTQLGKAIAGRCVHLRLKPPSREDLTDYARRIAKAERLKGLDIESLLDSGDGTYRGLAGQLEIYSTLKANPEEALEAAKSSGASAQETPEDELVAAVVLNLIRGMITQDHVNVAKVIRGLYQIKDGVNLVMRLGHFSWFLVSQSAAEGGKCPVWGTPLMWKVFKSLANKDVPATLPVYASFHSKVVQLRLSSGAFAVSGQQAVAAMAHELIRNPNF